MDKSRRKIYIQLTLVAVTFITTTLAGAEWRYLESFLTGFTRPFPEFFKGGLAFSIPFLLALTVHEFGHYFVARRNKLDVTLPYYIPFYLFGFPSIGTMGAFIRIREAIHSRKVIFDVGIAGPLAGFVVALGVLYYGFTHLPPPSYVYEIHPIYHVWGENYADVVYDLDTVIYKKDVQHLVEPHIYQQLRDSVSFTREGSFKLGSNLVFSFFEKYVAPNPEWVPNHYEAFHYPWLFAGYLALFFTALNLLPIGQLDGGHVLFGLIGPRYHRIASSGLFLGFVFYAGLGVITPQSFTNETFLGLPAFIYKPGLYILLLYYIFYTFSQSPRERLLVALSIFVAQFATVVLFPRADGHEFWLVFAFIIGRFLGVHHPPVMNNEPLDWKRKALGWIALLVFIVSFSPQVFVFD